MVQEMDLRQDGSGRHLRPDFGGKTSEVSNCRVVPVLCRRHTNELDNDFAI